RDPLRPSERVRARGVEDDLVGDERLRLELARREVPADEAEIELIAEERFLDPERVVNRVDEVEHRPLLDEGSEHRRQDVEAGRRARPDPEATLAAAVDRVDRLGRAGDAGLDPLGLAEDGPPGVRELDRLPELLDQ